MGRAGTFPAGARPTLSESGRLRLLPVVRTPGSPTRWNATSFRGPPAERGGSDRPTGRCITRGAREAQRIRVRPICGSRSPLCTRPHQDPTRAGASFITSARKPPICRPIQHNTIIERGFGDPVGGLFRCLSAGFRRARRGRSTSLRDALRDDGGMIDLRSALLVVLVVAAAAVSACGTSSSSTSSTSLTSSTTTSTTAGSGSGVAAARQKCLDATEKIQNSSARSTAEQACNRITTSNGNVSTALGKAKQTCLTAAAKIPIASLKQSAQAQCNKITAQ